MKKNLIFLLLISCSYLMAQEKPAAPSFDEFKILEKRINMQDRQLRNFNQKLSDGMLSVKQANEAMEAQLKSNLALQAQNERAANLTLDEFSKKFESQNKTMEGVQATLESQWHKQLAIFAILFFGLIIGLFIAVRVSTKQAIKNSKQSWDAFNHYILSGKYKNKA